MRVVSIDYETYFHKKEYSVGTLGNWRYCHDTEFDPYILSAFDGEEKWVGRPKDFNWDAINGALVVAHNASFERAVTKRQIELGVTPQLDVSQWQCTANLASFIADVRSLKDSVKVLEGRNLSKAIRDDMSGVHWNELTPVEQAAMEQYALGDVVECHGLWMKHAHKWPEFERQLSLQTMKQCDRGVRINVPLLEQYIGVLEEVIFNLERSLPWTERGAKPSSPIAIAEECAKVGIPAPPVKDEDEEGFVIWESTYGPRFPWVYGAGQWRSLRKLLSKFKTIKERLREDDTIDFSLLYFGAHTGRWSGGGSGLNLQNLRKSPLYLYKMQLVRPPDGLKQKEFKEWVAACTDFQIDERALLIPRQGKKFILADLSQIEPRVLAWLTGNSKLLEMLKTMSIYDAFARTNMGWTGGDLKKSDADKYQMAKIQVLGLGYGCAWEKFIAIAAGYDVKLTEIESKLIVSSFRETNPRIVRMWGKLDNMLRRSTKHEFAIGLPSGRELTYRNVLSQTKMKKNRETGKFEPRPVITADVGMRRKELYGGMLTENLVQATARDIFGEHMLSLEQQVGDVIFHVHDEALNEVELDVTVQDVEHVMSQTPEWIEGLPCGVEANEVPHYTK